jgi:sigma-B regulation protein RsbU (phosphoserine phosphatase)
MVKTGISKKDWRYGWKGGMQRLILLVVVLLFMTAVMLPVSGQPIQKRHVLILHSYHQGMEWVDLELQGITDSLQGAPFPVEAHVEYMDTKRFSDQAYFQELTALYAVKYGATRFDIIIACDDPAFAFVRDHRKDLFSGVPLVFCGINYFNPEMLRDDPLTTGVVETLDITETLEIAHRLQPSVSNAVVINDRTPTGLANAQQLFETLEEEPGPFSVIYQDNMTMDEIQSYVSALTPDTVVLLLTFNQDREGTNYAYEDAISLISPSSAVPVYGVWEMYLNRGIVGGMITSGYDQGSTAGSMALRILEGEDVSSIPVVQHLAQKPVFDHNQLVRFDLDESGLPPGSTVINRDHPTIELPVTILAGTAGGIVGLVGIIFILRGDIRKRERMEERLRDSEEKFRGITQRSFDVIFTLDTGKTVTYVSPAIRRVLGYSPEYVNGKNVMAFVPPKHRELFERLMDECLLGEVKERIDLEFSRVDGRTSYIEIDAAPIIKNGVIIGIQGVGHDVTEQKELKAREREAYAQIESNIEKFAVLGDHIRNPLQVILALATLEPSPSHEKIIEQVDQINAIITHLDSGWIHSENVRQYLRRHYGLESVGEPADAGDQPGRTEGENDASP